MDNIHIDLRSYACALLQRWRLIVCLILAFAGVGLGLSLYLRATSPIYEAQALVLISKPRYQVELEPRIKSSQEPVPASAPVAARLQTLSVLAQGADVEAAVQKRLGDRLPPERRQRGGLAGDIRVRPANELLRVTARARDPELSADLANAWAAEAAAQIEAFYGASAGTGAVESETEKARQAYEAADRALGRFLIENPLEDLTRRVNAKEDEIRALQDQKLSYFRARAASLYASLGELDNLLRDAETLRRQLAEPTRSRAAASGDALAVLTLRARAYLPRDGAGSREQSGSQDSRAQDPRFQDSRPQSTDARAAVTVINGSGQRVGLQFSADSLAVSGDTSATYASDLEAMIQALTARRLELQGSFEDLGRRIQGGSESGSTRDDGNNDPIELGLAQAVSDLQLLKAQQVELSRQRDELANQRKANETSYTSLLNKAVELRVTKATAGWEGATVVDTAAPPAKPAEPSIALNTLLAAVLGLLVGCFLVLGLELKRAIMRQPGAATHQASPPIGEPAASGP